MAIEKLAWRPKWCTAELGRLPGRHDAWSWMRVGEGSLQPEAALGLFSTNGNLNRDVITYS